MADRHAQRDDTNGRFAPVSTSNTAESGEGRFPTYASDLPVDNVSGAPSPNTIEHPRYAPSGDELAQGGAQRLSHRRAILVDEVSGAKLGELSEDALSQVLRDQVAGGRATVKRNNHMDAAANDHERFILGGE